ncbi:MAG TPA: pilus assembly protein TadG-related protein [Acidimicrobiia bacterium]|jgi:Flp pilus assembly protein TadG|nr:pilus assembly protein TadG-related protein [Acidimicrobiia bacterium]
MTQRRLNLGARRESGTITLWMLGLCLMLFLLGGISLDLWRAFSERRTLAATADAAAIAGASALDEAAYRSTGAVRLVPADAQRRARASLADQLDRRALRDARVDATEDTVMVTVGGSVDFSLLQIVAPGDEFAITVHATARPQASP